VLNGGSTLQTTIQATTSLSSGAMIQFGDATHCPSSICTDISVEHLTLDGNNQTITGILNQNAQDHTSVNHVTLYRILGYGLSVGVNPLGGDASNSGPYSNINYDTGTSGAFASTCATINGLSGTKGIHGLTCTSTPDSSHAILLDSSNNTLRDIRIVGFFDGILVGSQNAAHSNILLNVIGDTASPGAPIHVVHLSLSYPVSDISIMGVHNFLGGQGQYTIEDEVTSTPPLTDSYVAMYVLGEQKNNGYSRYTTSPSTATWVVGKSPPSNSSCATGSLYSCSGPGNPACPFALYGCVNGAWSSIK
jgi:hypothetical protein